MTLFLGSPDNFKVSFVIASTGFETTMNIALGEYLTKLMINVFNIPAVFSITISFKIILVHFSDI